MKRCGRCKDDKPLSEFHKSAARGYQAQCKTCKTEVKRGWISNNREKVKWNRIFSQYRLRQADFELMLATQGGRCAICHNKLNQVHIDHDHKTGAVRGLLCQSCNHFVGWIEKHASLIPAVQKYINMTLSSKWPGVPVLNRTIVGSSPRKVAR